MATALGSQGRAYSLMQLIWWFLENALKTITRTLRLTLIRVLTAKQSLQTGILVTEMFSHKLLHYMVWTSRVEAKDAARRHVRVAGTQPPQNQAWETRGSVLSLLRFRQLKLPSLVHWAAGISLDSGKESSDTARLHGQAFILSASRCNTYTAALCWCSWEDFAATGLLPCESRRSSFSYEGVTERLHLENKLQWKTITDAGRSRKSFTLFQVKPLST